MAVPEYIRAHSAPCKSVLLSIPVPGGTAGFTFLHAGRSRWDDHDEGLTAATEKGHSHPVYHAVLYTSGSNIMIHNGSARNFRRGTLVLTDPGAVHEYRPRDAGGGGFLEITFDLRKDGIPIILGWEKILSLWTGRSIITPEWPINILPPYLERMEALMDEVVNNLTSDDSYAEESAAIIMGQLILLLARYISSESAGPEDRIADRMEMARGILEHRYASVISIAELADVACLSEGAFIRTFSTRYGMPPMTYRKHLRITAAKHLLSVSGRPVGEIAVNVGYGDIFAFSRTFKAVTGMTASQWRRQKRQNND